MSAPERSVRAPEDLPTPRAGAGLLWLAAVFPTAAAWLYFVVLREHAAAPAVYTASKAVQFLLPVVTVSWLARRTTTSRRLDERERRQAEADAETRPRRADRALRSAISAGLVAGVVLSGGVLAGRLLLGADPAFDQVSAALSRRLETFSLDAPIRYLAFALFLSLVHSGLEEYYWRWFLLRGLLARWSRRWSSVISSLAFTSHHVVVVAGYVPAGHWQWIAVGSLGVFVAGSVWAWLYLDRRGIVAPWVSHAVVDLTVLAVGWEIVQPGQAFGG